MSIRWVDEKVMEDKRKEKNEEDENNELGSALTVMSLGDKEV